MPPNMIEARDQAYALTGHIVTMNDDFDTFKDGIIYIHQGIIVAVQNLNDDPPDGLEDIPIIETDGIIFPGLIELHNHLSYNILPMWNVPQKFERRSQWRNHRQKRQLVTAPMAILGNTPTYPEAIVRYVECKCLLAGVTTSQGISLYGVGLNDYYRGIVRNVEAPTNIALPKANTKISDVDDDDVEAFWERLEDQNGAFLLHLCEGVDDKTHQHFEALKLPNGDFAINDHLVGIHSTALHQVDFKIMAEKGGSIVWSPLSNLLLYGATTNTQAAIEENVMIALGSDWSPTGSKNLLGELKVAYLVLKENDSAVTTRDIVAMVTSNPAKMLKWHEHIGTLEPGKFADFVVVSKSGDDPYFSLISAIESDVQLVGISGIPRYGVADLMDHFASEKEIIKISGNNNLLNLREENADNLIRDLKLNHAMTHLQTGLDNIRQLAKQLEDEDDPTTSLIHALHRTSDAGEMDELSTRVINAFNLAGATNMSAESVVLLGLDEHDFEGFASNIDETNNDLSMASSNDILSLESGIEYSEIVDGVDYLLDPLTIIDDVNYFQILSQQQNLPDYLKQKLPEFYGVDLALPPESNFLSRTPPEIRPQFVGTSKLSKFLDQAGFLSLSDRRLIVRQALTILEQFYVHLPFKRSMHAVDPTQRLRLLLFSLDEQSLPENRDKLLDPEIEFHKEMVDIFTSLRDLHTNYVLPAPYRGKVAFLPFFIEQYYDNEEKRWRYIVSKIAGDYARDKFEENVEVLYWNGIPIERAIAVNAQRFAGSNRAARLARGLQYLTIRPLSQSLPPDEEWVSIHYKRKRSKKLYELRQDWLVYTPSILQPTFHFPDTSGSVATATAIDWHKDAVQQTQKGLYSQAALAAQHDVLTSGEDQSVAGTLSTKMPTVMQAHAINDTCGYLRIYTFKVDSADDFVDEVVKLIKQLPQTGLVIDIRENPGGLIHAAECLLQIFCDNEVSPGRAQFINSPLTMELTRLHAGKSAIYEKLDLQPWVDSIQQSVRTGAIYSQSHPITNLNAHKKRVREYFGKVVLIVDAMCYSAADIFAAGFIDHNIGEVIGISENTGAGGANVWDYDILERLMSISKTSKLAPLPYGATMRVAIRRTLRVGNQAGMPIEDVGIYIKPENRYRMSRNDLLNRNEDLLKFACNFLQKQMDNS